MNNLRARVASRQLFSFSATRSFASTRAIAKESQNSPGDAHTTKKPHELDPQAKGAAQGMQSKASEDDKASTGGAQDNATGSKDSQNATNRAKEEFPEAPDTIIGMQDERGKRE